MSTGPMQGRLGQGDIMKALAEDDVNAAEKWLYDDGTHIEDTEVKCKCQSLKH